MLVDTSPSRRLLWSLRGLVLVLLILHLAAPRFGEAAAWGLWPITFFAPAVRWTLALLVAALCIPALTDRLLKAARSVASTETAPPSQPPMRWFAALALLSIPLFWALRLVHTRWGDAYILTNAIPYPDPALRLVYTWQAPLTVLWHAKLWALGQRLWQWPDAFPAYAITSVAAGAVYVFLVLQLAWEVGRSRGQRLLVAGLLLSLGTLQLFFGYVENYTLPAVAIMIYLWLAARTLANKTPLWVTAAALGLANALHPSTLNLAPSLLVLAAISARRVGWPRTLLQAAAPLLLIGLGVIAMMQAGGHGLQALLSSDRPGGGDGRWLVPLWTTATRWEHYTMFSWEHLLDIVNQQLLSAPVSLAVVLLCLARPLTAAAPSLSAYVRFLAVAAAGSLLFILLWNPDYGGQRDWDLFSLSSLPLTTLAAVLLGRALPDERARWEAALALVGLSAFHTAAWIFQNTRPWEWGK
ncbi:MAG: hypothetical protein WAV60_19430 [Anaerolineae bacterium]